MNKYNFCGPFGNLLEEMIEYRVSLGYTEKTYLFQCEAFDKYTAKKHSKALILSSDIVLDWIRLHCNEGTANFLRVFAKYLISVGEEAYILPPKFTPKRHQADPHILTDEELKELFKAIDILGNARKNILPLLISTIYRLIYSCGLRPKEARQLKREHVNIVTGEIFITETKRNIERIVVMSNDMLFLVKEYIKIRDSAYPESIYFFPDFYGDCLSARWLNRTLSRCFSMAFPNSHSSIRVYDLRHQFASNVLQRWIDEKKDINVMLPYLQSYMGHIYLESTAYYIHMLPENISKSQGIKWDSLQSFIPEA